MLIDINLTQQLTNEFINYFICPKWKKLIVSQLIEILISFNKLLITIAKLNKKSYITK